jgi:hypothetical protein
MEEWIDLIPNKMLINIKIDDELSNKYNKLTNLKYIISFDVEFLKYSIDNRQIQTIHELGGLLLEKRETWYLMYIFHFNLIPIYKNIKQYYLLTSSYNTVSEDTFKKLIEIEKELLPENIIKSPDDLDLLKTNKIIKRYLSMKTINNPDFNYIKKKISKIKHQIKGYDLYGKEFELFKKSIELILNDSDSVSRQIKEYNQIKFLNLTNKLFSNSYLIVKGLEDIKALKNHLLLLKQNSKKLLNYFDIAQYNEMLFKKCNSAELEKTYLCLENLKLTDKYNQFKKIIMMFTKMKPHNPLVDAYYTWIIFNIL